MIDCYFIPAFINDYSTEFHVMEAYSIIKFVNWSYDMDGIIINYDCFAYCSFKHQRTSFETLQTNSNCSLYEII